MIFFYEPRIVAHFCYNKSMTFTEKVRAIVRKIPKGTTMTYKQVAARAGNPRAARAVGAIMHSNYNPKIPCHRVIASDGSMRDHVTSKIDPTWSRMKSSSTTVLSAASRNRELW